MARSWSSWASTTISIAMRRPRFRSRFGFLATRGPVESRAPPPSDGSAASGAPTALFADLPARPLRLRPLAPCAQNVGVFDGQPKEVVTLLRKG